MDHNHQRKIAVIGDFCGFGRCSLAVALPLISALKFQCCPVPTSVFSNHTGFPTFHKTDLTAQMPAFLAEWEKLSLSFEGVLTGYLGSAQQVAIVHDFLVRFPKKDGVVVVDPVMGDAGALYPSMPKRLVEEMKRLLALADCITPNLTEACLLTATPYREDMTDAQIFDLARHLSTFGPKQVVISGIERGADLVNFILDKNGTEHTVSEAKAGPCRSGTGDVFSAIITADLCDGKTLTDACAHAASFIAKALRRTVELNLPATDGIAFEEFLKEL